MSAFGLADKPTVPAFVRYPQAAGRPITWVKRTLQSIPLTVMSSHNLICHYRLVTNRFD